LQRNKEVNNAGYGSTGVLEDFSIDEIKARFETKFFAVIRTTYAILPTKRK
jgi:short-subunit dehydrogenase